MIYEGYQVLNSPSTRNEQGSGQNALHCLDHEMYLY